MQERRLNQFMKYSNFTVKDFVSDAFFQQWVTAPDAETNAFWENWLKEHPAKKSEAKEAREIITVLGFTPDPQANQDFIDVWNNIQQQIQAEIPVIRAEPEVASLQKTKPFFQVAVVLSGLLVVGLAFWLLRPQPTPQVSYSTAYGQVRKITLPDSSQVTLNANSTLSFGGNWDKPAEARQVWLKGEAFFHVRPPKQLSARSSFQVHTGNLTITVLGTRFNVRERRHNTRVVLQSGKVQVDLSKRAAQQQINMAPGEYLVYTAADNQVVKKKVDPALYTSWVDNELIFRKTSLKEIALLLEDNYGYQVTFKDRSLAGKQFTGTIPGNNIGLLFTVLSRLYDLQITQQQQHLIIARNKQAKP